ncbi:hypothetical protein CPB86DRAFT_873454 [Serendipita vermifera]|nr:hypothetical protein CPB86DRAFT_873454 [Serendipita vermifera]
MAKVASNAPASSSREWDQRQVADAAPTNIRKLLTSSNWVGKEGELAIKVFQSQLDTYYHNVGARTVAPPTLTTLFDAAAQRIATLLEEDPENLDTILETINPAVARAMWSWPSIPYAALCSIWRKVFRDNVKDIETKDEVVNYTPDVDNWIIQNEDWLRQRLEDPKQDWRIGLVTLDNCDDVLFSSKSSPPFRRITRNRLDGWKCLDAKRSETISIQPGTNSFKEKFEEMTLGQLKGLDWSNIFIAGGIVLGTLLCTGDPSSGSNEEQWKSSDIDIYIYGLNPIQANEKIKHLFTIFRDNLPEDASILVIRNSRTISFISNFPRRRFQIILKIVKNPAEVLLNFDLDICAMGFDGESVYMLPRASRALETGYNVFTMDMVQGHYLGTRKATHEERVFKYAYKGYGIRILPRYLEALKEHAQSQTGSKPKTSSTKDLDFENKVASARSFFDGFLKAWVNLNRPRNLTDSSTYKPVIAHASLDTQKQLSKEPLKRSCLTGFELFYRHVCLWEAEQNGKVEIREDVWASTTYDDDSWGLSYNELPSYKWDESFKTSYLETVMSQYNSDYQDRILNALWKCSVDSMSSKYRIKPEGTECWSYLSSCRIRFKDEIVTRKAITGSSLEEVMQEDLSIPIWLPEDFLTFARDMVKKVSNDMPDLPLNECFEEIFTLHKGKDEPETLVLVKFTLSPVTIFQQIDRRLDEIFEIVWSFMHSNAVVKESYPRERTRLLKRQLSRRSPRRKSEDEYKDFAAWIERSPMHIDRYSGWGPEFWRQAMGDEEPGDNSDSYSGSNGESDWESD